jgi:hypothetical protein
MFSIVHIPKGIFISCKTSSTYVVSGTNLYEILKKCCMQVDFINMKIAPFIINKTQQPFRKLMY